MSKELLRKEVEKEFPVFNILDMKYIEKDKTLILSKGKDPYIDDKVYFKLDTNDNMVKKYMDIIFDSIMRDYFLHPRKRSNDEYYIVYDSKDKIASGMEDKAKGGLSNFAIRRNGKIYYESCEIIGGTLMYMESLNHPKLEEAKQMVSKFAHECYDWIKEKIQRTLMINVKGDYVIDNIEFDTYFQRRCKDESCYDYIIHDYHKRLANNEIITWADFMDEGKVYVAID